MNSHKLVATNRVECLLGSIMGIKFNNNLCMFFQCDDGAYSDVTGREFDDGQITVTGHEKTIITGAFADILRGSVKNLKRKGANPEREFRLYPDGREIQLNLVYPKKDGNELRLYLQGNKFRPAPSLVWFVFVKENILWVGALDSPSFGAAEAGFAETGLRPALMDITDSTYQESIYSQHDGAVYKATVNRIRRDPKVTKGVLENSGYRCEICPDLQTFTSKVTGKPYLEAHHLIPVGLQLRYELELDVKENIAILNPWSHRLLHHGQFDEAKPHLEKMIARRKRFITALGITKDDVLSIYKGT